ncbi:MAG: hypothetical protein HY744_08480 [Deltaproteobacteria bacterium]|nr:hypothetical protein [Deltaproteobacteria bacterium]
MPFTNLSSPRKVAGLGAEVASLAALEPANLIAALTTDPVTVSAVPFAGGTSKPSKVALGAATEVALLSKAVAVVRSGDEIWALLDIQHTPKLDQAARDIRSLHANPGGETAFAIGWGGRGAELKMHQHEVVGRDFTLRGELRACAIGAGETYAVVDGPGGGQLRAHPGATPESAPSARADLPADAAPLDRLAGGRELAALFKRGTANACVVRRAGMAPPSAKMVVLDGPAVGVAVIASSLFAIGADGKLRLFNADALQGAGPEPMTPTAVVDVRANGEPTVLAATTRGGNRLWIGTRAGDVIRVDALKRGLDV